MAEKKPQDRGLYLRTLTNGKQVWYVRLWDAGRKREFGGFKTKTEAKHFYQEAKVKQREARFFPETYQRRHSPTLTSIIDLFLPTSIHRKSYKGNLTFAKFWKDTLGSARVGNLRASTIDQTRAQLLGRLSQARVNRYYSWLKHCLNWALKSQLIPRNPCQELVPYHEEERPYRALSDEELGTLLSLLDPYAKKVVELSYYLGLRRGEFFRLEWEQIDLKQRALMLTATKSRKLKIVPLHPRAAAILEKLYQDRVSQFVFPSPKYPLKRHRDAQAWVNKFFKPVVKQVGLSGVRFHSLRHTFGAHLAMQGVPGRTIQQLGGWSSLKLVERYTQLQEAHLRESIGKLGVTPSLSPTPEKLAIKKINKIN